MRSTSFDLHVFLVGNHTDAWPAVWFHLVEIFHASKISCHIGSSSLSGFLAWGISSSNVINASDLLSFWAVISESNFCQGSDNSEENEFHLDELRYNY
jgi:hypothetical protein